MLEEHSVVAMLPVEDLERAKAWYADKLGFRPTGEFRGGAHYRSGTAAFDLYETGFAGTAQHTLAAWMVDDIERVVSDLRERGVVFEEYDVPGLVTENGIADLGYERSAWFKDSEGNILAVGQETP